MDRMGGYQGGLGQRTNVLFDNMKKRNHNCYETVSLNKMVVN